MHSALAERIAYAAHHRRFAAHHAFYCRADPLHGAGAESGEISFDGAFTVIEAECLGACGFPTAVQINERYYENVTPDDVPAILERLRRDAPAVQER